MDGIPALARRRIPAEAPYSSNWCFCNRERRYSRIGNYAPAEREETSISKISAKKEPQSAYRPRVHQSGEVHDLCQVE